jgi:hypothetical protein
MSGRQRVLLTALRVHQRVGVAASSRALASTDPVLPLAATHGVAALQQQQQQVDAWGPGLLGSSLARRPFSSSAASLYNGRAPSQNTYYVMPRPPPNYGIRCVFVCELECALARC